MNEVAEDELISLLDEKEELLRVVRAAEAVVLTHEMIGRGLGIGPGSVFELKRAVETYRKRNP